MGTEAADKTSNGVLSRAANPPRWVLLTLLCLAILARGRVVQSLTEDPLLQDPDGYAKVANNIVEHGRFAIGLRHYPVTSASRPPLYPTILAALQFFGERTLGGTPIGFAHVAFGIGTIIATWFLGRLWSLPAWAAILATLLVTIDPIQLHYSAQIMTETLAALLATATLVALTRFGQVTSSWPAFVAGVCSGLCILCRPEFLVWIACVSVAFPFIAIGPRRVRRLATYVVAVAMVVAPWAIRNVREFRSPVITTTHGGITLLLANNPSFYEYLRSAPWGSTWDGREINQLYNQLRQRHTVYWNVARRGTTRATVDEVAVDREAYQLAFEYIRAEPAMFAYSCLVRVGRLWAVLPHATSDAESPSRRGMRYAVGIFYVFELALAVLGAWFLGRKLLREPWIWGTLLLASYTLVHAFYWTDMRMRAPLVPVIALLVAVAVSRLATKRHSATPLAADA